MPKIKYNFQIAFCDPMISNRVENVKPSTIIKLTDKVRELKRQGKDVISFTIGEPDFPTPKHIVDAGIKALREGKTHYAPSLGIPSLREAIAEEYQLKGLDYTSENILVTPAKFALYAAVQTLINPGDEVIIQDPSWVSFEAMVVLSEGRAIRVPLIPQDQFSFDPEKLKEAVSPKTKALIVNSPSNPTGGVLEREHLKLIADLALDYDFSVIADETYEKIIYEGEHLSIASLPEMMDRSIIISSFSKSYSMTGWRLGWLAAPKVFIPEVLKIQQHTLTCVPPFVQEAGIAALKGPKKPLMDMVEAFRRRRDIVGKRLNEIEGISISPPRGTFYAFFHYNYPIPSIKFSELLIDKGGVALTPGAAFGPGGEGFMRLSFSTSETNLEEGIKRIKSTVLDELY